MNDKCPTIDWKPGQPLESLDRQLMAVGNWLDGRDLSEETLEALIRMAEAKQASGVKIFDRG